MPGKLQVTLSNVDRLARFGLVAGIVVLISLLYPSTVKFKYEFQKGQSWRYEDLAAPFDFAIQKTDQQVSEDRQQVFRNFSPYYRYNTELAPAKIKDFEAAFNQNKAQLDALPDSLQTRRPDRWLDFGKNYLAAVYARGIVKVAPEHQEKSGDFVLNLVKNNVSTKRTLTGFYTVEQVRQMLIDTMAGLRPPMPPVLKQALLDAVGHNVTYDADFTEKQRNDAISSVATTKGVVRQGDLIVKRGNVVTEEVFDKLVSFRQKFEQDVVSQKSTWIVYGGYLLLTALIVGTFMMYLNAYRKEILAHWNYLAFVLIWLLGFSYLTYLVEQTSVLSVYVIPYCIVPIVVRHFFTYRLAFFTHVVVVMIAGFLTQGGYQFAFTQIVAGVVAVLAITDARYWTKFFTSVLFIFLSYALSLLGLTLIEEGDFKTIDWGMYGWLVLNGILTLMAFPLIPLMERLFGFTSAISLVELTDMSRPLLRQLAMKAPGTFQHSLQVGNLAEAAAGEVGADPLLVRTGALYHDIGKMRNPEFFVENQSGSSPHEGKSHIESARIIIEHVTEGEKLAKKHGVPKLITRFITTHHGTTKVAYFYKNYLQENPGVEVDPAQFTYPGPKPQSKEEAILMLADSVEATSRTLKDPTGKDIDDLVDKIVQEKIDKKQLDESKLTFGNVETCKQVFKKMLRSIHHVRLEYPE